jgi:2-keto-4-pentenoate hydratase/2-oxohepta-3-ene-1,7-dioic acid hydratase (catechol pathway)
MVIGPGELLYWPSYSEKLDYELEFGIFTGKEGMNIPRGEADEYIADYTIFNDISARDVIPRELSISLGPAKGKMFHRSTVMGPCITTPDQIGDPTNLRMEARVNGEIWSQGNSKDMYWKFS